MNSEVQKAANTFYQRDRVASGKTVRDEKRDFAHLLATRRRSSHLPLSGPEFQAVLKISSLHVERCIRARFESYRAAFQQAEVVPTDLDFREILKGVQGAREQEVRHASFSLQQYAQVNSFHVGPGTGIDPSAMLMSQSGETHDSVIEDWKSWRAEIALKAEAAKKSQVVPMVPVVPNVSLADVLRKCWSWPVVSGFFLLLLSVAGNTIYAGDMAMTAALCSLGLSLFVIKFVHWNQTDNPTHRLRANATVIIAAAAVLVGAIGLAKKKAPQPLPLPFITMQISSTSLPVSIPPHTTASILQIHPWIAMTADSDGLLKVANDTGKEGCWPKRAELATIGPYDHESAYRIEITNHSDRIVESGIAKFGIKYNAGVKGGGCTAPKDQRRDQDDLVLIPPLDPGRTFDFYASNPSSFCAWLLPPSSATLKIGGQEKTAEVPLILDKNPLYSAGAPVFSPTSIKWEGIPAHPNGLGVVRMGADFCEAHSAGASD